MKNHCCDRMNDEVGTECPEHSDPFECPDAIVHYSEEFDEYGIIVHDGGNSVVAIEYCPWCGKKLPDSKRSD